MKPLQCLPLALCLLHLLLMLLLAPLSASADTDYDLSDFNRTSFPPGFLFGTAIAAYQFEGAATEGGRGPSIWDTYAHKYPEKILDHTNGDVADDMYHRYNDDIKLLKSLNVDTFRMSISWTRILPRGKLSGGVNQAGVDFYNSFINELLAHGITPFVTIFHWDLPQALEDEYKGFLSPRIINDYRDFAEVCFQKFGDRVKNWMTFNEPLTFTSGGYDGGFIGHFAPGRCTPPECPEGNSATEPYIVAHNLLLAHAATVKLYREKYQAAQKGKIGIVLVTHWFVPYNASNPHDVVAARRTLDFIYGWFLDPIVYGRYPKSMEYYVGERLPKFSPQQSALLKGSFDFLGVNYYTGNYAAHVHSPNHMVTSTFDKRANLTTAINGVNIGKATGVGIFFVYPQGLRELLIYTKENYNDPTIFITENGMGDVAGTGPEESTNDPQRIDFYNGHLKAVQEAIKKGVKVKGYFAWTYMDGWEWGSGFTQRFGLVYVDFKNGLKRIPKKSALWVRKCLSIK